MGIIIRQSAKASISSYIGAALGFVNVAIVMNQLFTPDEFGLRAALLDIAVIFSMISQLGTSRTIVKMHPFFSHGRRNDNGLFTYSLLFTLVGFFLISTLLIIFRSSIIAHFSDDSALLEKFYWAIFPLTFFMLLNLMFESNLQARVRTAFSAFVNQVVVRLSMSILLLLYYYSVIDFTFFILLFVFSYSFNLLLYLTYMHRNNMLYFGLSKNYFRKKVRKIYLKYSLYSIWTNIAGTLTTKLDSMMLLYYLGLSSVAIYSNAAYLIMMISVPSASITKVSFPVLTKNWKKKRIDLIEDLYKKSSINQFLFGGTLFLLLWINLDSLFDIQQDVYSKGRYVILILGIGQVFNMLTGINAQIINASKYYPFLAITSSILIGLIILTNIILIPRIGIEGAALGTATSVFLYNSARYIFIFVKMKIQPFSKYTVMVLLILAFALILNSFLPKMDFIYFDVAYRSLVLIIVISISCFYFKVSPELNSIVRRIIKRNKL